MNSLLLTLSIHHCAAQARERIVGPDKTELKRQTSSDLYALSSIPQVHRSSDRAVGGTGLGLAISKSLCESMGGAMGCTSTLGNGSTFHFTVLVGVRTPLEGDRETGPESTGPRRSTLATVSVIPGGPSPTKGATRVKGSAPYGTQEECPPTAEEGKHHANTGSPERQRDVSTRGTVQRRWPGRDAAPRSGSDRQIVPEGSHRLSVAQSAETNISAVVAGCPDEGSSSVENKDVWLTSIAAAMERREQRPHSPKVSVVAVERPRILVVDDIRVNRMLMRKLLEALDVTVELEEDGAKAVDACRRSKFSLILMDVMMPVMDGLAATKAIRSMEGGANRTTPIIAATASATVQGSKEGDEAGITDVSLKPITRKALFGKIAGWGSDDDLAWMGDVWMRHTHARTTAKEEAKE